MSVNIPSIGNTISFDISNAGIQKDMSWSAQTNDSWLSFKNGQNGIDNGKMIVQYENNLGDARSGSIKVIAPDAKAPELIIQIFQDKNLQPDIVNRESTNDIRINNNTGKQFVITAITPQKCSAYLIYGTSIETLHNWKRVDDDRGDETIDNIHYFSVKNLSYNTQYHFELVFGTTRDNNNNGQYYTVTTAPMTFPDSLDTCELSGVIFLDKEQTKIADNAIISAYFIGQNETQKSNIWAELVEPVDNGRFKIILNTMRNLDNQSLYPFTCGVDPLLIEIQAGSDGSFRKTVTADDAKIEGDIVLSRIHTINIISNGNGSISPPGIVNVDHGTDQVFTINPDSCSLIDDVLIDNVSIGPVNSYTISNIILDHKIEAKFITQEYSINTDAGPNGTMTPSMNMLCGDTRTIEIKADNCYSISDVLVDDISVGAVELYTITNLSKSLTIKAMFKLNEYSIITSSNINGYITQKVPCGTNEVIYIEPPDVSFEIDNVTIDGRSVKPSRAYTLHVTSDHHIEINFGAVYNFQEKWNPFALRFRPKNPYNTKTLIQAINSSGGQITKIWHWDSAIGCQRTYSVNDDNDNDVFEIEMGRGYFLLSEGKSTWINTGDSLNTLNYAFTEGLYLCSFPFTNSYNASTLGEIINNKGGNISVIYHRNGSEWISHEIGSEFDDFNILANEAYFIQSDNSFEFEFTQ